MKKTVDAAILKFRSKKNYRNRKDITWVRVQCPQQNNSIDCGFFVLRFMRDIIALNRIDIPKMTMKIHGKATLVIKEKLKGLKDGLKCWNKELFRFLDPEVEMAEKNLNAMDHLASISSSGLSPSLVTKKEVASCRLWKSLPFRESMIRQKSRHQWIKEGDYKSRFFSMEMKHRFTRNKIAGVISNAGIIDKVEEVRKEVKCHFEEFFLEPNPRRLVIDGVDF
ncbi:hypothetical protein KIW84_075329 [Lathyrus oleraceus]|uniref:Ubiquitin-like protease family profile domain-containing protein n=1 Tax=Pisum sativum TaxID=3888 RepID=A0A9D4VTN5_PEA|nr:hypothetical protein KIW84_075329 [Pisum sativum]